MGTELGARGLPLPMPEWSAWALEHRPEVVAEIHREYARAGATVHTANTFRTKRRDLGPRWEGLARRAVAIARQSVPSGHRVAGSIAPLEDCYRPDLSPRNPGPEHGELASVLADAGVDLLLCETFAHVGEALAAVEQAVATGIETWVAFTAGPGADLLTVAQMAAGARRAVAAGARACLVNCVPATASLRYLAKLCELAVPAGVYANAGATDDGIGWGGGPAGVQAYLGLARQWVAAGAVIVGGCCGTDARHIHALAQAFGESR